jgi:tetratricopeptide (TPR) repeat protein
VLPANPCFTIRLRSLAALTLAIATLAGICGCRMAATGQNVEGVRQYQQGQYPAALQRFQQAVAADPANADAYYNLAATVHRMGVQSGDRQALSEAEKLYNECLNHSPNHVDCHRALAVLLVETDRSDRAFALLKNWAVRSPQLADSRIELARLYHEFGDRETAKLHLDEAIRIDHQNPRAWAALGRLREDAGDYQLAMENYQRSLSLNTFQPGVAARVADLRRTTGGGPIVTPPGGTRTVDSNSPALRY